MSDGMTDSSGRFSLLIIAQTFLGGHQPPRGVLKTIALVYFLHDTPDGLRESCRVSGDVREQRRSPGVFLTAMNTTNLVTIVGLASPGGLLLEERDNVPDSLVSGQSRIR